MCSTCEHANHTHYAEMVSKMIQIRNVPDEIHLELKVRAAQAGMSLSDYLNAVLARLAATRPLSELVDDMGADMSLDPGQAADAVRAGRLD